MTPELKTRFLSATLLNIIIRQNGGLEEEFARVMAEMDKSSPLEQRDRMFVRLLLTTTLRRLGQIDDILSKFLKKKPDAVYVVDLLRLAVAQILFLKTPAHASVNTTVDLVKQSKFKGFAGLVNAVLHNVIRQGNSILEKQNSAELNTPKWLLKIWQEEYGVIEADNIADCSLEEAPLDFTVKEDPVKWATELGGIVMPNGTVRRNKNAVVPELNGFKEGSWWVQDLSASMPARLFKDINGKKVADVCAAPGGKTAQLICFGANVTAIDISKNRIKRLQENLSRLGFNAEICVEDALKWVENQKENSWDAILLDAPCSATGTLRRHPDVVLHRSEKDIDRLSSLQKELLLKMHKVLKKNGTLVYCVCSIIPKEGRLLIDEIEKENLFKRIPLSSEVPNEMISKNGDLTILPTLYKQFGGCDGFYAARLKKI
ncbi:MAG: methyltransferase domain-containing protein [Alphaproteobacteria bacterium]|nr:methyltransferase domain-containing protein [Alphaproteobacteria bacterium]